MLEEKKSFPWEGKRSERIEIRLTKEERDELVSECARLGGVKNLAKIIDELRAVNEALTDIVRGREKENETLRGLLGHSSQPCAYCGLPAEEQAKCAHGFPGCARADDQALTEYFAAGWALEDAQEEIEKLRASLREKDSILEEQGEEVLALRAALNDHQRMIREYAEREARSERKAAAWDELMGTPVSVGNSEMISTIARIRKRHDPIS